MKVFYDPRQTANNPGCFSPSAGKPAKALASWQAKVPVELMRVEPCIPQDLCLAHDPQYVDDVLSCRINNGFENRSPEIATSLLWTNGSFYSAARHAAVTGDSCVSPTSGFHHAEYYQGMGFCTFNGLMMAAIKLKSLGIVSNVAIVDLDMHYGNGTDNIIDHFEIDYVTHYTLGNYTIPRMPFDGQKWLKQLPDCMAGALSGADVLFYQAGADPHVDDPVGGALTTAELRERDRIVFSAAKAAGVPVVWNLAGGYQSDFSKVLEIHDNTALEHVAIFS